ncbi:MAG: hypothetical protein HRU80_12575 [Ignavibacteriales bacterium]|nr:hypothetical protein [Ignavibacteriaceae bacterium]MCK6612598.1 hypothetical protein [Ignavibacteriaceae bacterium]QOJ29664.1 MAG: hypothetical protein HRU80_12575 [Ignavibacteriales bacterium]
MDQLITLLGTYFIGGYITLSILVMNYTMSTRISELVIDKYSQESAITTAQILESDLYKAGYRSAGNSILLADSSQLRYISDIDNNGTTDTVYYYRGTVNDMSSTKNPADFRILRRINSTTPLTIGFATRFVFSYQAENTSNINLNTLNSQANRNTIRFITVYVRTESPDSVNFGYSPVEWRKQIRPKNL